MKMLLVSAVALIDRDGRVLLAQRPEGKSMMGLWEFPGGKVEDTDTNLQETALRETEEEVGVPIHQIEVLKTLSPFTSSISINMEPVYAIFLALFFFGDSEKMTFGFYSGALLIFLTILSNAWLKSRLKTTP